MSSSRMTQLSSGLFDALAQLNLGKEDLGEEYSTLLNSYTLLLKSMNLLLLKMEENKQEQMLGQHKNVELKNNLDFLKNMAVGMNLNRPC
ncbi:MAG: hypothetical protein MK033_02485 [Candidatus Caenarcaniphilales bacterium]|nr:hypothetical protein [Candidatus Caenarcaniphilales bacterium]